ncbi:MAG TPA: hypothetical protein PKZ41_00450 [Candidatus Omnitrophota bacterium]|nr:hypothetical protein [Candidatus Omnitrophota bacterium]
MRGSKSKYTGVKGFLGAAGAVLIIIVLFSFWESRPTAVSLSLAPKKCFVGDRGRYLARISAPLGAEFEDPKIELLFAGLEIRDVKISKREKLRRSFFEAELYIPAYDLGKVHVPELPVRYLKKQGDEWSLAVLPESSFEVARLTRFSTSDLGKVRISSALSGGQSGEDDARGTFIDAPVRLDIKDSLPVRKVKTPRDWMFIAAYWTAGLIVFLAFGIFITAMFLSAGEKLPLTPRQKALDSLKKLEKAGYDKSGDYRSFCSALYGIISVYVSQRVSSEEIKMTSKELAQRVGVIEKVPAEIKEKVIRKIFLCDSVKYSPGVYEGSPDYSLDTEKAFIEMTSPDSEKGEGA